MNPEELQTKLDEIRVEHQNAVKELQKGALEQSEAAVKAANDKIAEIEKERGEMESRLAEVEAKMKGINNGGDDKPLSFNDAMAKAVEENAEKLKSFKRGDQFDMALKAAGDMGSGNFSGTTYANITTDYRQAVLPLPTERIWMRDILPSGTTTAGTIWYPRHTGGEGGTTTWQSGNKPQIDFDFDSVSDPVRWIAGYVKVPREMLDDVAWLQSFLRANMLLSLYKTENQQILNGDNVAPNLNGIIPQATAYDGSYTIGVERIIDAGYGQVNENEGSANVALLHPRDAVAIILNKASGSGEYDLPPGTIGFVNNRLSIAGMTVVQTKEITQGTFLVGDNMASQFITRLSPEIRVFEQNEDDAKKNLIMFRIEERAALATYYPTWWVKGSLSATT